MHESFKSFDELAKKLQAQPTDKPVPVPAAVKTPPPVGAQPPAPRLTHEVAHPQPSPLLKEVDELRSEKRRLAEEIALLKQEPQSLNKEKCSAAKEVDAEKANLQQTKKQFDIESQGLAVLKAERRDMEEEITKLARDLDYERNEFTKWRDEQRAEITRQYERIAEESSQKRLALLEREKTLRERRVQARKRERELDVATKDVTGKQREFDIRDRAVREREENLEKEITTRSSEVVRAVLEQHVSPILKNLESQAVQVRWLFDETVRKWIAHNNQETARDSLGSQVVTIGSGPIDESDFDEFLRQCGIDPCPVGSDLEVMVVGREGWSAEKVEQQIQVREGKLLRVYSQEMVFAILMAGDDPLESGDRRILNRFAEGHPALEWLMKGLKWPDTILKGWGSAIISVPHWVGKEGLLSFMGYHVGMHSFLGETSRREILCNAMTGVLREEVDGTLSGGELEKWGPPGTRGRLRKLKSEIEMFIRLKEGRSDSYSYEVAIDEWQSDLAWLRRTFYRDWMGWKWPETGVPGDD